MRRREVGARRFSIIVVLVMSLVLTLVVRLYWVQVLDPHKPHQTAGALHQGDIVVPAPRGTIVDSTGHVLVGNTTVQVLTIDKEALTLLPDHGAAVLARVARLLHTSAAKLDHEITPCSPKVPAPCWTGEPYQPVPVATARLPMSVAAGRQRAPRGLPGRAIADRDRAQLPRTVRSPRSPRLHRRRSPRPTRRQHHGLTDADTIGVSRARGAVRQVPARCRRHADEEPEPAGLFGVGRWLRRTDSRATRW